MKYYFREIREMYDKGRKAYPLEVVSYVLSFTNSSSKILDMGCGTGIATRQMALFGVDVYGCDADEKMIEIALKYEKPRIRYYISPAKNIPFDDKTFDIVTAFGAFHWFCDNNSVSEIRRVLKDHGVFVAVNKYDIGRFRNDYRKIVKKITEKVPISAKKGYNPLRILERYGFKDIRSRAFNTTEKFSIEEALIAVQSVGRLFDKASHSQKQEAITKLREHFINISVDDIVDRPLEIRVVSGVK